MFLSEELFKPIAQTHFFLVSPLKADAGQSNNVDVSAKPDVDNRKSHKDMPVLLFAVSLEIKKETQPLSVEVEMLIDIL